MNIERIVRDRRCLSCGYCRGVCPTQAIDMTYNHKEGFYRPIVNTEKCIDCRKCLKFCPAENQQSDTLIGEYQNLYLAHSNNNNVRVNATSGGCINAFVRCLLDKSIVDCVLTVKYDKKSPIEACATVITSENSEDLLTQPRDFSSRYVIVPILSELKKLRKRFNKIAVVGTPCQLRAIVSDPKNNDIFKIGITCSGGMSYKATEEYKRVNNMSRATMYYRGNGWPGYNTLISGEKTIENVHTGSYFEQMFSSQIFKNPGCRYCKDHFAEFSDISCCDFWNSVELKKEIIGNTCVIVRCNRGKEVFDKSTTENYIEIVRELNEEETLKTQASVLKVKKSGANKGYKYKIYTLFCDWVFSSKIYRIFNKKIYQKLCNIYKYICSGININ